MWKHHQATKWYDFLSIFQATDTYLVNDDPTRGPGMPECFLVSDTYRVYTPLNTQTHTHTMSSLYICPCDHTEVRRLICCATLMVHQKWSLSSRGWWYSEYKKNHLCISSVILQLQTVLCSPFWLWICVSIVMSSGKKNPHSAFTC